MNIYTLLRTDLNLLVALMLLLEEQHVGKAADRMFVTQSAMSKMLAKLRIIFDDQLLTKMGQGVTTTQRALELYNDVVAILESVEALIAPPTNDPELFDGTINIQASDFYALPLLPKIISTINKTSPKLKISVTQEDNAVTDNLIRGHTDIAIVNSIEEYNTKTEIISQPIFKTQPVILLHKQHPLKQLQSVSWDDISNYKVILLKMRLATKWQNQFIDYTIDKNDLASNIILETTSYLSALDTIINSECIMFAPRISSKIAKEIGLITSLDLPNADDLMLEVNMIHHRKTDNSVKYKWIREEIFDIFNSVIK